MKQEIKSRSVVLLEAYHECLRIMYKYAQPSIDFDAYCKKLVETDTKEDKMNPLYRRHYLSSYNSKIIRKAIASKYNIYPYWREYSKHLINALKKGDYVNTYIEREDDSPGYKSFEKKPPLSELIGEEKATLVIDLLQQYADYFRFDWEDQSFNMSVALGPSPNTNKEDVIKYWKSKGKDIEIKDFDIQNNLYYEEEDIEEPIDFEKNGTPIYKK